MEPYLCTIKGVALSFVATEIQFNYEETFNSYLGNCHWDNDIVFLSEG